MGRFRTIALGAALALVVVIHGCSRIESPWDKSKSPHILVSFPPIYCFAASVDPQADVQMLMTRADPHSYKEPSVQDAMMLREANLFFVNGLGLDEKAAHDARRCAGTPKLEIVELGELIPQDGIIKVKDQPDPHIWVGIPEAMQMVEAIRDKLKKDYPARARDLDASAAEYLDRLKRLLAEGKQTFAAIPAEKRKIISFHDSLQYFARSFDIDVVDALRKIPEKEPTAEDIASLVKICKEQNVRVIVAEPEYGDGPAVELRNQLRRQGVPAEIVVIDPLEIAPEGIKPDYYEQVMKKNIQDLAEKLR
jgi:ABC-type Zn uptake system ZnuABC Zn-binding protein ZnuA